MKKTSFFKLLMVGALALTLGFAGCDKGPSEKAFEELCDRVDLVETSLADLKTKLNAIEADNWVTDVQPKSAGSNTLVVTYKTGKTVEITIPTGGGNNTTTGVISVGTNGNWYFGTTDSGYPVVGPAPKVEDGVWKFPTLKDGAIVWEAGSAPYYNAYATNNNGVWTLHVPDADGVLQAISLPSQSEGVTEISVLGWLSGYNDGDPVSLANITTTNTAVFPILFGVVADADFAAPAENASEWNYAGKDGAVQGGKLVVKKKSILVNMENTATGIIAEISPASLDGSALTGMTLENSKGEAVPVKFGTPKLISGYLTRAAKASVYFVPLAPYVANETQAAFENKIKEGTNNRFTLVTPDGTKRSDYTLEVAHKDIKSVTTPAINYVQALVNDSKGTYDITTPNAADGAVSIKVGEWYSPKFQDQLYFNTVTPTVAADGTMTAAAEIIEDGEALQTNATHSSVVADWYFKPVISNSVGDYGIEWAENNTKFRITKFPDAITIPSFKMYIYKLGIDGVVAREEITMNILRENADVEIDLDPYLVWDNEPGVNDYLSKPIEIPLTKMIEALKNIKLSGGTTMYDVWTGKAGDANDAVDQYQITMKIDGEADGAWTQWNRFVGNPVQAKTLAAENKHAISLAAAAVSTVGYGKGNAINTATVGNLANNIGNSIVFGSKSNNDVLAIATNGPSMGNATGVKDFAKVTIVPTYAYNDAADANTPKPSFVFKDGVGKKHSIKITFYNSEAVPQPISSITAHFTPTLPDLKDMFKKDTAFWTEDQTVLNAYYRTPDKLKTQAGNWWFQLGDYYYSSAGTAPTTTTFPYNRGLTSNPLPQAATAYANTTYYNVLNPGLGGAHSSVAPLDGGFTMAGVGTAGDDLKKWVSYADLAVKDGSVKIGSTERKNLISTGQVAATAYRVGYGVAGGGDATTIGDNATIVELNKQYVADHGDNAYGVEIPMTWKVGKYLGIYSYASDAIAAQDFKIKVMSALAEGTIVGKDGTPVINLTPGTIGGVAGMAFISKADLYGINYSKNAATGRFELFRELRDNGTTIPADGIGDGLTTTYDWVYKYTYIKEVSFTKKTVTASVDFCDLAGTSVGATVTKDTIMQVGETPGVGGAPATPVYGAVIPIISRNTTSAHEIKVGVKITDRFGRTLDSEVTVKLAKVN